MCTVKYKDLDRAMREFLKLAKLSGCCRSFVYGKSDLSNAFHLAPIKVGHRCWLKNIVRHPITKIIKFFVDKCMPFRASISCVIFQAFSDALQHILDFMQRKKIYVIFMAITNYRDNFLFIAMSFEVCNAMVDNFMAVCLDIGCPVSAEKN